MFIFSDLMNIKSTIKGSQKTRKMNAVAANAGVPLSKWKQFEAQEDEWARHQAKPSLGLEMQWSQVCLGFCHGCARMAGTGQPGPSSHSGEGAAHRGWRLPR